MSFFGNLFKRAKAPASAATSTPARHWKEEPFERPSPPAPLSRAAVLERCDRMDRLAAETGNQSLATTAQRIRARQA